MGINESWGQMVVKSQSFLGTELGQNENFLCCSRFDPVCFGAHLELWDSETILNNIERTGWKRRPEREIRGNNSE